MADNIMLNMKGAITQPCLIPLVTGNGCEDSTFFALWQACHHVIV